MTKDFHCYVRVIEIGTMEKGGINGTEGEVRGQRSPPSPPHHVIGVKVKRMKSEFKG